jgi:CTP-dependent riboflavin kinase
VLPSKDVRIHDSLVIEIITDRDMKQSLGLRDGDAVTIEDVRPSGDSVAGQG